MTLRKLKIAGIGGREIYYKRGGVHPYPRNRDSKLR